MAGPGMVEVKGIGELPQIFSLISDDVKLKGMEVNGRLITNGHNEGRYQVMCSPSSDRDDFNMVFGYKTETGYHVDIITRNTSRVALWNDGRISLNYNEKAGHWSMEAMADVYGDNQGYRKWAFCDPMGAVYTVLFSLQCYSRGSARQIGLGEAVARLSQSLLSDLRQTEGGEINIIASAALYDKEADCQKVEVEMSDPYDNVILGP